MALTELAQKEARTPQHGAHVPLPAAPPKADPTARLGESQPLDSPADGPDAPPIRTLGVYWYSTRDSPPGPLLPCPPCRARASVAAVLAAGRCPFLDSFASPAINHRARHGLTSHPHHPHLAVAQRASSPRRLPPAPFTHLCCLACSRCVASARTPLAEIICRWLGRRDGGRREGAG
jgi:hypothetical protein